MYIITWKKCNKRRTWKGKESLSHEYKRSRRHTTVIFLSIYVTYWKPSPNLAPYHLSFAPVKSRRVSAISYIQFPFSKIMFYCWYIFIFIAEVYNTFFQDEQHERNWWKYKSQVSGLWCKFFSSLRAHKRIPMFVITLFITLTWYQS